MPSCTWHGHPPQSALARAFSVATPFDRQMSSSNGPGRVCTVRCSVRIICKPYITRTRYEKKCTRNSKILRPRYLYNKMLERQTKRQTDIPVKLRLEKKKKVKKLRVHPEEAWMTRGGASTSCSSPSYKFYRRGSMPCTGNRGGGETRDRLTTATKTHQPPSRLQSSSTNARTWPGRPRTHNSLL